MKDMDTMPIATPAACSDVDGAPARSPLEHRLVRSLDFNWRFHLGDVMGAHTHSFDDRAWRTLHVPHDWAVEGEVKADAPGGDANGFSPGGLGWYRRNLDVDDALEGKRVLLQFDGVHMNSDVWLNDHWLGRYPYGFSTFFYDVTEWLKPGLGNVLAVRVQPDEGIALRFTTKEPGNATILRDVAMDFRYGTAFGSNTPEAYERLLLDAMRGDATLFTRRDEVVAHHVTDEQVIDVVRIARDDADNDVAVGHDANGKGPPATGLADVEVANVRRAHSLGRVNDHLRLRRDDHVTGADLSNSHGVRLHEGLHNY